MSQTTISVRIERAEHEQMKRHDDIKWSSVIRHSIHQKLQEAKLQEASPLDTVRARHAAAVMDKLRRLRAFDHGRPTGEIIREWREKRR